MIMKTNQTFAGIKKEVLRHIDTSIKQIQADTMREIAMIAPRGIPPQPTLDNMNSKYNGVVTDVRSMVQPRVSLLSHTLDRLNIEEKQEQMQETKQDVRSKINSESVDRDRIIITFGFDAWKWKRLLILLLCFCDIAVTFEAYQLLNASQGFALIIASGMAFGISYCAEELGKRIAEAQTFKRKLFIFLLGLAGSGLLFWFIGLMRSAYMESIDVDAGASPVWSFVVGLFFFALAMLVAARFAPPKEQEKAKALFDQHERKIRKLNATLKAVEADEEKSNEAFRIATIRHAEVETFLKDTIQSIEHSRQSLTHSALLEYTLKASKAHIPQIK